MAAGKSQSREQRKTLDGRLLFKIKFRKELKGPGIIQTSGPTQVSCKTIFNCLLGLVESDIIPWQIQRRNGNIFSFHTLPAEQTALCTSLANQIPRDSSLSRTARCSALRECHFDCRLGEPTNELSSITVLSVPTDRRSIPEAVFVFTMVLNVYLRLSTTTLRVGTDHAAVMPLASVAIVAMTLDVKCLSHMLVVWS